MGNKKSAPCIESAKTYGTFSEKKANILINAYIKDIGIDTSIIIPTDITDLCMEYYLSPMPQFECVNCSVNYDTGLIKSTVPKKSSYIITKNPWKWDDTKIHKFEFEFLSLVNHSEVGIIEKSKVKAKEGKMLFNSNGKIFRYGTKSGYFGFTYGANTYVTNIEIRLDMQKEEMTLHRSVEPGQNGNIGRILVKKGCEYHVVLCWKSESLDEGNDDTKFRFVNYE